MPSPGACVGLGQISTDLPFSIFHSGAEPKGDVNLKIYYQSYSVVPESERYRGMHGIELKFKSRFVAHERRDSAICSPFIGSPSFFLWSSEGPDRFQVASLVICLILIA
jgi:hypothetical protein